MPQLNEWDITLSHIRFFMNALAGHQKVASYERTRDIVFDIERRDGLPPIKAVLINRYTVGVADVMQVMAEFPGVTCVVTTGDWCGYTREAKEFGLRSDVGVFNATEFFGALWKTSPEQYVRKDLKGAPVFAYRSA